MKKGGFIKPPFYYRRNTSGQYYRGYRFCPYCDVLPERAVISRLAVIVVIRGHYLHIGIAARDIYGVGIVRIVDKNYRYRAVAPQKRRAGKGVAVGGRGVQPLQIHAYVAGIYEF